MDALEDARGGSAALGPRMFSTRPETPMDGLENARGSNAASGPRTFSRESGASCEAGVPFPSSCFLPEWVGLLGLLEDFVATWDDPRQAPKRASDPLNIRDGWRCSAPGCTSRQNLEDHHIQYRSRGGGEDLSTRIPLCRFHHQHGEHGDLMECRGRAPLGIEWRLGRDGRGGRFRKERRLERPQPGTTQPGTTAALTAPASGASLGWGPVTLRLTPQGKGDPR